MITEFNEKVFMYVDYIKRLDIKVFYCANLAVQKYRLLVNTDLVIRLWHDVLIRSWCRPIDE